jgi:hypothetical protein
MKIQAANLIPKEYMRQKYYTQLSKKVITCLMASILILLLFTSIIFGSCYYLETNRDMDVPANIRNEYTAAQANSELLKKKTEMFVKAKSEDSMVIETLAALLSAKPTDIKLTRFDIANTNVIQIEGFANDPASFNQYVAQINAQSTLFSKAVVEKIAGTTGEAKTFSIKAERSKKAN